MRQLKEKEINITKEIKRHEAVRLDQDNLIKKLKEENIIIQD
jgi:hypothetical protein